MEMKIEFFGITIRTGKDCIGNEEQAETPEQQSARMKAQREFMLERISQPSSEEGKQIYWSRVTWYQAPFEVVDAFMIWLRGGEVWYSKTGARHVTRGH